MNSECYLFFLKKSKTPAVTREAWEYEARDSMRNFARLRPVPFRTGDGR